MKVFTDMWSFNNNDESADAITNQEVKFIQIRIIEVDLNSQLLEIKDVCYISNIMSTLLFTNLLKE